MRSEEEIKNELEKRIKMLATAKERSETIIICDWLNCLVWVLQEDK